MLKRVLIGVGLSILTLVAVPVLLIWWLAPHPLLPPDQPNQLAQVDAYFQALVETGYPPGIAVVVRKDRRRVFNGAYGTTGPSAVERMTPQTSMRWWSVTKLVTAAAVLQLVDRGRVALDDPVDVHLPFVALTNERGEPRRITVLQLLNHSAGVANNMPEGMGELRFPEEPYVDQVEYARELIATKSTLIHEPGSHSSYSNTSYIVLGALVQAVSGERFEDYVRREILLPLGMTRTDFEFVQDPIARGAHPVFHFMTPLMLFAGSDAQRMVHTIAKNLIWFNEFYLKYTGSTSLNGPVVEMSRFNQMVLNRGVLDGVRILSQPSARIFVRDHQVPTARAFGDDRTRNKDRLFHGIGWQRISDDRYRLFHSGGGPGFAAHNVIYPDEYLSYSFVANGTDLPSEEIVGMLDYIDWANVASR